jgi:shikimate kinase
MPQEAVIALGGGCWQQASNRRHVSQRGLTIFLDWPFEILLRRIQGDVRRPLATDPLSLYALFCTRRGTYMLADLVIPLTALDSGHATHTAKILLQRLKANGVGKSLAFPQSVDKNCGGL